jgi:parallel beta-helix repeat protein
VADNLFVANGANGISAVGSSGGEIRSNLFDNTGFGLAIGQRSTVRVLENRIVNNRDGIVISNVSRPVLRGNLIANNLRNGVVILPDRRGVPNPDLGSVESPGGNVFRANGEKDINNATAEGIVAIGNELDQAKLGGTVNFLPVKPQSSPVPSAGVVKPAS